MRQDKKAAAGQITLVLVRQIGKAVVVPDVDQGALKAFLLEEGAAP
jgi:3-dehydroquinate synthase